ncbi:MAG: DUF2238 domain-containing protein [Planctomycetota bacterium]|jgi:putative membrane protein
MPLRRFTPSYRAGLLVAFLLLFWLSVHDLAPSTDLLLQHILTVLLLVVLLAHGWRYRLSNSSYTLLFCFMLLHLVGARHYYSSVPYDEWTQRWLGFNVTHAFDFSRNHYDRLVHFLFGLLILPVAHELLGRNTSLGYGVRLLLGVVVVHLFGSAYEFIEWTVAMVMDPQASATYNGQQGDIWDPHRDLLLAVAGAATSSVWLAAWRWHRLRKRSASQ